VLKRLHSRSGPSVPLKQLTYVNGWKRQHGLNTNKPVV
jgi:hypothetical protein